MALRSDPPRFGDAVPGRAREPERFELPGQALAISAKRSRRSEPAPANIGRIPWRLRPTVSQRFL